MSKDSPSVDEVQKLWKTADVIKFIQEKKEELDLELNDKYIEQIEKNEVSGRAFLKLTTEKLLAHPYNLPGGPAEIIADLVNEIKGEGEEQKLQAPSILVAPKDITTKIIKQLIQSPGQLPHKSDLANFLNENPPVKIPLASIHFSQFNTSLGGITEEERDTYFILSTEVECTSLYLRLIVPLIYPPSYGKTEDSYHCLWDCVIKNTIETFGMHNASLPTLEFDRNTSKRNSTGRNRPDMVVLVRNICPFRGEEKSREEAGDPSSELIDKIKPENKKRKLNICSERIAEFDLGRLSDRIRIMNFLRNICRILPIIVNLCPPRDSPEFQTIMRTNGTVIELGYAVKKKFADEKQVKHLKEIYGMLCVNNVRFSDELEHSSTHSVNLAPRGEQREPKDLKELLQALICILTCLKVEGMHEIKPKPIMHRDIRWPNIIRHYGEYQRFILIDFDYANYSPSDEPLKEFSESDHAPEILTKGHDFKVDIWGIGNLIGSCNVTGIPPELSSFSTDLCKSNPNKRPTASVALDRVKDMFRKWFPNDDWLKRIEAA
ncbi:serine/threonine protein kinase [Gigaspora margarita]|uniref:Serine/threonine protein kinase n=1 Tax=Gigaspora margarita TaxID=4874 RepID=A0A8H3X5S1_GIGMA|nr:serine/threonine protein kinase [Gigaspora margarita]